MSFAVYVYADANKVQQRIRADQVNWTGTWSSTGTYAASTLDTVQYGSDRFIAIIGNVGVSPVVKLPNKRPNPFSQVVVLQPGDEPPFAPPVPADLPYLALQTAWQGTAAANAAQAALAVGAHGTVVFYAAPSSGAPATTAVTVVNGVITSVV